MTPCFQLRLARTATRFTCSQALCPRKLQTRDKNRFYIFYMLCTYAHAHTYFEQNGQKHTTHALWTVNMSVSGAELTAGEASSSTTEALGGWADRRTDGRLGVGRRVLDVVSDCDCASSLRLSAHGVIPTCSMITSPSCCRVSSVLLLHRLNIFIASMLTEISKSTGNKYSTKMIDCRHVNPEIRRLKKNIYRTLTVYGVVHKYTRNI